MSEKGVIMEIDITELLFNEPEVVCFHCHQRILERTAFKAQGHNFCNPQHYLLALHMLRPVKRTRKGLP
jgi:hypothetical protein